ncbi:hypothetical protein MVLG_06916 [Microbotryum lychnidis-dioicae p1A1 Lamole]|uniref:Uncharacterized protein n=1 Tax=Microbotryum lychnidis-dioicae (strain p1A1 Lamole / MvSl-1064) TaxID=683840 RepID=U5HIR8_USTV1|nr:hypothetical protein MVLG_06916 [Microbotryum lychnidis-dioicae p1A1 Lamole]|eukprot:KDE02534.1 hypothetical protein MVLG_06916 [Microbotryum lychnidis-dioicae p1A1 Lamole]
MFAAMKNDFFIDDSVDFFDRLPDVDRLEQLRLYELDEKGEVPITYTYLYVLIEQTLLLREKLLYDRDPEFLHLFPATNHRLMHVPDVMKSIGPLREYLACGTETMMGYIKGGMRSKSKPGESGMNSAEMRNMMMILRLKYNIPTMVNLRDTLPRDHALHAQQLGSGSNNFTLLLPKKFLYDRDPKFLHLFPAMNHCLMHVPDVMKRMGPLCEYSACGTETMMGYIKGGMRSKSKPVESGMNSAEMRNMMMILRLKYNIPTMVNLRDTLPRDHALHAQQLGYKLHMLKKMAQHPLQNFINLTKEVAVSHGGSNHHQYDSGAPSYSSIVSCR